MLSWVAFLYDFTCSSKMPLYHTANLVHLSRVIKMLQRQFSWLASGSESKICGNDMQNKLTWGLRFSVMSWSLVNDFRDNLSVPSSRVNFRLPATNLRLVTSHNSEGLKYTAAEAWNKWICLRYTSMTRNGVISNIYYKPISAFDQWWRERQDLRRCRH